jgi:iron(III) transport system ATP-binding protein
MIRVDNLEMTYGTGRDAHPAVRNVSFNVGSGLFYTLLGPSGCGKTTTLRCIAGLERPAGGRIMVGDQVVFSALDQSWVPPSRRQIGMVFQSYAIWPHLDVFDNVAFPLRRLRPKPDKSEISSRVLDCLELVKLGGLEHRPGTDLSGGQQQRLALARALVFEPRVLLLDEPLSNLDAKLRDEMRSELKQLTNRLGITTIFVTHEQVEALTMSDRIAVMNSGKIVQEGTPNEIYRFPVDNFVADFIGKTNLLQGSVIKSFKKDDRTHVVVDSPIGNISGVSNVDLAEKDSVVVLFRPENVFLSNGTSTQEENVFQGTLSESMFIGNAVECAVEVEEFSLKVHAHPSSVPNLGDTVSVRISAGDCQILVDVAPS